MTSRTAEFQAGASGVCMPEIITSSLGVDSPFSPGDFNGTTPVVGDDPIGLASNMANPRTSPNGDFNTPTAKENIPVKASLNGMV